MARLRSPTARSPRRASSSAATSSSTCPTATRRCGSRCGSQPRGWAPSRSAKSRRRDKLHRVLAGASVADVFLAERARVLATAIRVANGDFDLAEEAVQDAFEAALARWPVEGTPAEPRHWLISVARNKVVDTIRRRVKLRAIVAELDDDEPSASLDPKAIGDDRLRLIFTCCHPALAQEAQIALTLRTLGGLTTDEIARAFIASPTTMAQRLVRAKSKI